MNDIYDIQKVRCSHLSSAFIWGIHVVCVLLSLKQKGQK